MATKEMIAEMSNEERVEALNKAIRKQVNKHFKGSSLQAEVVIKVSKCKECSDDDRIPTDIKKSLNRLMQGAGSGLSTFLLDELEKAATDHPALEKDPKKKAQVTRMFGIRRELNALVDQEEQLIKALKADGANALPDQERKSVNEKVKALNDAQAKLLDELQNI
jgi:hypothetical protein